MSEFLNPKSMLTPGVAGAVMMFVVNGLSMPFPELPRRFIALVLSFLFGLLFISKASEVQIPQRIAYWVINSLVIFVVGFGANDLGREAIGAPSDARATAPFVAILPSAYAEDSKTALPAKGKPKKEAGGATATQPSEDEARKLKAELEALRRENAELKRTAEKAPEKKPPNAFFKKW